MFIRRIFSILPSELIDTSTKVYHSIRSTRFYKYLIIVYTLINSRRKNCETKENFLRLHIGCGNRHFPGYVNIDIIRTKATDLICNAIRLPFPDRSIEVIEAYHMIEHLPKASALKALNNWWTKLIPGGTLILELPDFDQVVREYLAGKEKRLYNIFGLQRYKGDTHYYGYNFHRLKKILEAIGYRGVIQLEAQDYHRLEEPCIRVEAYKSIDPHVSSHPDQEWIERKVKRPETLTTEWRETHIHTKILKELNKDLFLKKKTISFGCGSGELEVLQGSADCSITGIDISNNALLIANSHKAKKNLKNINFVRGSLFELPFKSDSFDSGYSIEVIEHIEKDKLNAMFSEIRRVLKDNVKLLITTPNKDTYFDSNHRTFFTKSSLKELIDKQNISLDWIDLEEREDKYRKHEMLKAMLTVKPSFKVTEKRKVCAIGGYDLYGYNQLGFHWDGQASAFNKLGYETRLIDIRKDSNYYSLKEKILTFRPDILLLGLLDCLPLLKWMEKDIKLLREKGCKVIYWYCDLRNPSELDLKNLIDFMFVSNNGQIETYKKAYNLEKVFYMPQGCTPLLMHRLQLDQTIDIGFAGNIASQMHSTRAKFLKTLRRKYNVSISNEVRNNISNFYSKCKIVFGANADDVEYLYTSNRFFVAMGCGGFYLCEWFPGINRLAKNHEHIVWFKSKGELLSLVDYYLKNDREREIIRKNAQSLAHKKHTYISRIQNIIDIIDGKSDSFHGFI